MAVGMEVDEATGHEDRIPTDSPFDELTPAGYSHDQKSQELLGFKNKESEMEMPFYLQSRLAPVLLRLYQVRELLFCL